MTILIYFIQCVSLVFSLKATLETFLFISELYMFAKYSRVHLLILIKVSCVFKKAEIAENASNISMILGLQMLLELRYDIFV